MIHSIDGDSQQPIALYQVYAPLPLPSWFSLFILRLCISQSKCSGGNQAAGCHEEGRRSAGWTVWKKIYMKGDTTGRQRVSLQETAGDRCQWTELVAASTAGSGTSFVMTTLTLIFSEQHRLFVSSSFLRFSLSYIFCFNFRRC